MTELYGLIGYPLTHSFSPGFFNKKFETEGIDAVYTSFPIAAIKELPELLKAQKNLKGLNVTIPYKEAIIPYLDEIDEVAAAVGAVNCIVINKGKTKGYNTDIIGFERSLTPLPHPIHNSALVLGTGGASKAVLYALNRMKIEYQIVSRTKTKNTITYGELTPEIVAAHKLIINTTPVGMYPNIDGFPDMPYSSIYNEHLLYDLIYNPAETLFLQNGRSHGATVKNGLEMLHLQAIAAWELWNKDK